MGRAAGKQTSVQGRGMGVLTGWLANHARIDTEKDRPCKRRKSQHERGKQAGLCYKSSGDPFACVSFSDLDSRSRGQMQEGDAAVGLVDFLAALAAALSEGLHQILLLTGGEEKMKKEEKDN